MLRASRGTRDEPGAITVGAIVPSVSVQQPVAGSRRFGSIRSPRRTRRTIATGHDEVELCGA
jgi:hypothetical protein